MRSYTGKGGFYPALFLFSIFFISIFQIKSYDLWWHLKAGEYIAGAGLKPAPANTFSWTEPDHPWLNFSWLFDVIVYSIYNAAGFNGLIIFQAILVTAVFYVVYKTVSQFSQWHRLPACEDRQDACPTNPILILVLFLIAYFAARFRFSLRPHLLALLFFAIDIYLLNKLSADSGTVPNLRPSARNSGTVPSRFAPSFFLIPLIQILWANVHGSAIIGVLLPGIYIIGDIVNPPQSPFAKGGRKGDFFLILLLTISASFFNPYGYKVLTEPFAPFFGEGADLFGVLTVDEWQMPGKEVFFGWYGLLLAMGIMSFLWQYMYGRGHLAPTDISLFLVFAILSIKAVRFIDLFAVAAVPVIYKNIVGSWEPGVGSRSRVGLAHHRILSFSIIALFWFIGIKDTTFTPGLGVDEEVVPKKAVEFMERNGIEGRIFNSYNFGGYLIYKDYPVFIDGRLCYSTGLINGFADANLMKGWKKIEEKYRPDIVLVEYAKPLVPSSLLMDKENWALVYWDDLSMLFLRRSRRFSDIIAKSEYRYLNPMDMYGRGNFPSPGGRGLRGGGTMNIHPHPDPLPSRERGDTLFWEKAVFAEAGRRIKEDAESMRAHLLLGNLYMSRGEPNKAISEYRAVIESPHTFGKAEAHNNLGSAYERTGDLDGAEMEYKTAIRLDKAYPLPQRNLGYLKLEQSEYIEALRHLDRHLRLSKGDRDTAIVSELKKYRDTLILRVFIGGSAAIGIIWIVARAGK